MIEHEALPPEERDEFTRGFRTAMARIMAEAEGWRMPRNIPRDADVSYRGDGYLPFITDRVDGALVFCPLCGKPIRDSWRYMPHLEKVHGFVKPQRQRLAADRPADEA